MRWWSGGGVKGEFPREIAGFLSKSYLKNNPSAN